MAHSDDYVACLKRFVRFQRCSRVNCHPTLNSVETFFQVFFYINLLGGVIFIGLLSFIYIITKR